MASFARVVQIDPVGCGCTECIVGEYVPLDQATDEQVAAMLRGELSDATGERFDVSVIVTAEYSGRTWTFPQGTRSAR